MIEPGTKLIREHSPELGVGVVVGVEGRFVDVFFPDSLERQRLAAGATDVRIIELKPGDPVRTPDGEVGRIAQVAGLIATLESGTEAPLVDLWPVIGAPTGLSRLMEGAVDPIEAVLNRLDGLSLLDLRREGTLQSLLGGRIELFPHQLDTAARAIDDEQVRWLVADEVGLGKTIVACLVLSALIRMGRVERALIIAPDTLTVQWLGELYHKFHQVFVHVDEERIDSVRTDFGDEANPFDIHPLAVVSFELLDDPAVMAALEAAPPQLVVVDEAHRALRDDDPAVLALSLVESAPHALMLTATPFQLGREGFLTLTDTLGLPVINRDVAGAATIVKRVSCVTRADIHDLPARKPQPVPISHHGRLTESDPRVAWLLARIPAWRQAGHKALVFVESSRDAIALSALLERNTGVRAFAFHDEMRTAERDIELAHFRLSGAPVMVSSGAGSEGRNFQFCDLLVHMDLPDDPVVLEQRIGRLDRIGRTGDIPIHWFKPGDDSRAALLAETYERLGIFADARIGASPAMVAVGEFLAGEPTLAEVPALVAQVEASLHAEAVTWIFPSSHDRESAPEVMAQVPGDLDERIEQFCIDAAERVGLDIVPHDGTSTYFFEHGNHVVVDTVPGVPHGTRFLGSFSRQYAVLDSECEFFANGHPLVEGLLLELEDSLAGRSCAITVDSARIRGVEPGLYLALVCGRSDVATRKGWALLSGTAEPIDDAVASRLIDAVYEAPEMDPEDLPRLVRMKPVRRALEQVDADDVVLAVLVAAE